jgi:hypothetical protein
MKPALVVAAALLSSAAIAEESPRNMESSDTFSRLDADGDEKISKDEAAASESIAMGFDRLDGNSDGFVSKREFRRNTMARPKPPR